MRRQLGVILGVSQTWRKWSAWSSLKQGQGSLLLEALKGSLLVIISPCLGSNDQEGEEVGWTFRIHPSRNEVPLAFSGWFGGYSSDWATGCNAFSLGTQVFTFLWMPPHPPGRHYASHRIISSWGQILWIHKLCFLRWGFMMPQSITYISMRKTGLRSTIRWGLWKMHRMEDHL